MPLDAERVAETRAWFQKAAEDLCAARYEMQADPPFLSDIVFHAQQAAEKSLKGFLAWHGRPLRKTHDLVDLGRSCAAIEPSLADAMRRVGPLTE